MVSRVFDRRGRQNWSAEKRQSEDQRLRDRRQKSDRRSKQRRQGQPWPEGRKEGGVDQRIEDRRKLNRRSKPDDKTADQQTASITPDSSLFEVMAELSSQKDGFVVIRNADKTPAGILSERSVVRAIAEEGIDALSQAVSRYLTALK